jgi:adenosylhomocysteinase
LRCQFPVLQHLSRECPPARGRRLILVTHLLPTARPFVRALSGSFEIELVGIPYSSDTETCAQLEEDGIRVAVADSVDSLPGLALERVLASLRSGAPVVVQEIGGYLAEFSTELGRYPNFLGVVEDTNNGHWRYAKRDRQLRYPVVSIAQSPIKRLEDRQVGQAVAFSVDRVLRESFYDTVAGKSALILGFGSIGSACANALRQRSARVTVHDVDPVRNASAGIEGYNVLVADPQRIEADVIIGATGTCSLDRRMLARIPQGAVLFSASSKRVEIDIAALEEDFDTAPLAPDIQIYRDGDHFFYLAYGGYPVNFRDESVLGPALDAVYSELFVCIREVAAGRAARGLRHSWPQIHQEVASAWCQTYLPTRKPSAEHLEPSMSDGAYPDRVRRPRKPRIAATASRRAAP